MQREPRRSRRGGRRALVPLALCAAVLMPTAPALAEPDWAAAREVTRARSAGLADAQQRARALRARLVQLRQEAARSVADYEQAEDDLADAVARSVELARELESARRRAQGSAALLDQRVAALYKAGGSAGLLATLVDAGGPGDLAARLANVGAVVRADSVARRDAGDDTAALALLESGARDSAGAQVRALQAKDDSARRLAAALEAQTRVVADADEQVRAAVKAQQAAARAEAVARLAAARAAARRAAAERAAAQRAAAERAAGERAAAERAAAERAAGQAAARAAAGRAATRQDEATYAATDLPAGPAAPVAVDGLASWTEGPFGGGPSYVGPPGVCPVGPSHSFTDTWGAPRVGHTHQGTDVFAPEGSPAYAVVDAVVVKENDKGIGGITLTLRGDDGDRYYYAHNRRNLVRVGERVRAGQQIAEVGRTGNAETTPPHIHFQAHPGGGRAVNPYGWLAALCAS